MDPVLCPPIVGKGLFNTGLLDLDFKCSDSIRIFNISAINIREMEDLLSADNIHGKGVLFSADTLKTQN